jgi:tight adherence protein C
MLPLIWIFAFVTVAALLWSGIMLLKTQENPLAGRLEELQSSAMVTATRQQRRKAGGGLLSLLVYAVSLFPGADDWIRANERQLRQAGVRSPNAIGWYTLFFLVFLGTVLGGMAYLQRNNDAMSMIGGLAAAGIIGFLLPKQALYRLVRRYRRRLQEALPDTVDLLGIVLGTGLALDQAMTRVSEELQHIYPELAGEFYTVVMQVRAGQERAKAFQQLVRRTGIEDIKSLAAMIVQSEKFGTSLAQALKVYADALRTRRRLRAEAAVGKAGIKMLFPIILFILPVLFVITLVPGMLTVLENLRLLGGGQR